MNALHVMDGFDTARAQRFNEAIHFIRCSSEVERMIIPESGDIAYISRALENKLLSDWSGPTSSIFSRAFSLITPSNYYTTHCLTITTSPPSKPIKTSLKMPRQSRGRSAAPSRPVAAPSRPSVGPSQAHPGQTRTASTAAYPPAKQAPSAPAQQSQGPGLFGQMASTAA